jgi:hypothetical protein
MIDICSPSVAQPELPAFRPTAALFRVVNRDFDFHRLTPYSARATSSISKHSMTSPAWMFS